MKDQKGFSLIEVVIAVALLGIIGASFLSALATASKVILIADVRATAESLARTEMEYVRDLAYTTAPSGGEATYLDAKISAPSGYEIRSVKRDGSEDRSTDIIAVPWNGQLTPPPEGQAVNIDVGRQRIKLVIYHLGKLLFTLEGYRSAR